MIPRHNRNRAIARPREHLSTPPDVAALSVFLRTISPNAAVPYITRRQSSLWFRRHSRQCHLRGPCVGGQMEGGAWLGRYVSQIVPASELLSRRMESWDDIFLRSSRRQSSYQDVWSPCTPVNPGLSTSRVYTHVGHIFHQTEKLTTSH